jgi:hypothetical protein
MLVAILAIAVMGWKVYFSRTEAPAVTLKGKVICKKRGPADSAQVIIVATDGVYQDMVMTNNRGEWTATIPTNTSVMVSVTSNDGFDMRKVVGYPNGVTHTVPDLIAP